MSETITTWGRQCKAQMILLDKSLKELASEVGYTPTYVSSIINGRSIVKDNVVQKISAALSVDPDLY